MKALTKPLSTGGAGPGCEAQLFPVVSSKTFPVREALAHILYRGLLPVSSSARDVFSVPNLLLLLHASKRHVWIRGRLNLLVAIFLVLGTTGAGDTGPRLTLNDRTSRTLLVAQDWMWSTRKLVASAMDEGDVPLPD